jgi:uncharacterized repeat protein (TIGR04052 family)
VGCGTVEEDSTQTQTVTLQFAAQVGEKPFACGETYQGLGVTDTTFEPFDFRLYVSEIEMRDGDGNWQALELDQDTPWQHENLALLDFEDRSGRCSNGTTQTRDIVTGFLRGEDAPTGLRFTIGVPFELNHIDVSMAPSPLNQTALFWNWLGGYKFVRMEGATTGMATGWQFHLGSTACVPGEGGGAQSCEHGNRVVVEFGDFQPGENTVIFDVAALVANADMDASTENTPRGCMAGAEDPDCTPLFGTLGLSHGGIAARSQSFVRMQ